MLSIIFFSVELHRSERFWGHLHLPLSVFYLPHHVLWLPSFSCSQSRNGRLSPHHLVLIAKGIDVSCFLETSANPEVIPLWNDKRIIKCEGLRVLGRLWPSVLFLPMFRGLSKLQSHQNKSPSLAYPFHCNAVLAIIMGNFLDCLVSNAGTTLLQGFTSCIPEGRPGTAAQGNGHTLEQASKILGTMGSQKTVLGCRQHFWRQLEELKAPWRS